MFNLVLTGIWNTGLWNTAGNCICTNPCAGAEKCKSTSKKQWSQILDKKDDVKNGKR